MHTYQDGSTFFVTLECLQRKPLLANARIKKLLVHALHETKKQFNLHLGGYVILDDHAHFVFVLPVGVDFQAPMNFLRARFLRDWREMEPHVETDAFWEHGLKGRLLKDVDDLRAHLDYIHYDPVRHREVWRAFDYPWSSFRVRVDQGHYPEDWSVLGPPASLGRFEPHYA